MDDVNPPLNEATPLIWLVLIMVAWLAGHLLVACTRDARRQGSAAARLLHAAAAVVALATGVFATMAMTMSGQPVAYSFGYRADALVAAWALAALAALLPVLAMGWKPSPGSALVGASWFGIGATAAQAVILWAAGLLPGLVWRHETLALAAVLQALLLGAALWLAFLGPGRSGRYRRSWRAAAAAVVGLALIIGAEVVLLAGDMATQIASAHADTVSLRTVKLLAAVLVPLLLLLLAGLLHLSADTASAAVSLPGRRRRRRRRWWAMRP
jgi:hypothetical protein